MIPRGQNNGDIGLICNSEHDVFSTVAEELGQRGYRVVFFEPGERIEDETIDGLDLLANKKVDPESMRALRYAAQNGIPTWNGYLTVLLGARPIGMIVLREAGFDVPLTTFEKPEGDCVAKSLFDWHYEDDPEVNGEGEVYQRLLPTDSIDYKYYGVDDGSRIHVTVLRSKSKLYGEKEYLDHVEPDPDLASKLRRLVRITDSQAIGVDIIRSRDRYYAVDVNPAMSFRNAGMENELADSMAARVGKSPKGMTVPPGSRSNRRHEREEEGSLSS